MKTQRTLPFTALLIFVFTLALGYSNAAIAQEGAPKLKVEEFEKLSKKDKKGVILDIRTPEEYKEGYIEGAEFLDFLGQDFESGLEKMNKKKTYYVYCRSGKRTIAATEKMKQMGFKKVYMLDGGITAWSESGRQTIKDDNQ